MRPPQVQVTSDGEGETLRTRLAYVVNSMQRWCLFIVAMMSTHVGQKPLCLIFYLFSDISNTNKSIIFGGILHNSTTFLCSNHAHINHLV